MKNILRLVVSLCAIATAESSLAQTPVADPQLVAMVNAYAQKTIDDACAPVETSQQVPARAVISLSFQQFLANNTQQATGATNSIDVAKAVFDRWRDPLCTYDGGWPRLTVLHDAEAQAFGFGMYKGYSALTPEKAAGRVQEIAKHVPDTDFAVLIEANFLLLQAWEARGNGFNGSVTPEGARLFQENLQKAHTLLLAKKEIASNNPEYYVALLQIDDGYSPELVADFKEGARKFPLYETISRTAIDYSLTKWGGSPQEVDDLINWSVKNKPLTPWPDGKELIEADRDWYYARFYVYYAAGERTANLFKETLASWPRMKHGMLARIQHADNQYWLNLLVRFACEANDAGVYKNVRAKLGSDIQRDAWNGGVSPEFCDAKFKYRM